MPKSPVRRPLSPPEDDRSTDFIQRAVTRIGQLIALLALVAIIAIIVDQTRHALSAEYTLQQRSKHEFMCFSHSRKIAVPQEADFLVKQRIEIEQNVYTLMDVVRQQNAPTEFFGKLRHFSLCSSFSKAGIGGFEVAGAKESGQSAVRIGEEEATIMLGKLEFLKSIYPDFPELSSKKLTCELTRLVNFDNAPFAVCSERGYVRTPAVKQAPVLAGRLFDCETTDDGLCLPYELGISCACKAGADRSQFVVVPSDESEQSNPWLLVVGADQTDEAAARQVRTTRDILKKSDVKNVDDGDVQLRLVGSWRRTVVTFATRDEAQGALKMLLNDLPYGGYVRYEPTWCPDLETVTPVASPGITSVLCEES